MAEMNIKEILKYLPHRYPFVLIDRVLEYSPGKSLVALKNVSFNEPFFPGHFPEQPVMPAVLILESMAQATGLMGLKDLDKPAVEGTIFYFVGIDKARFRKPVVPGDQLVIEVNLLRLSRGIYKVSAVARVDGGAVAEAELMGALREPI